eukprot:11958945-Alexandrium_andersonii.AAC.1
MARPPRLALVRGVAMKCHPAVYAVLEALGMLCCVGCVSATARMHAPRRRASCMASSPRRCQAA